MSRPRFRFCSRCGNIRDARNADCTSAGEFAAPIFVPNQRKLNASVGTYVVDQFSACVNPPLAHFALSGVLKRTQPCVRAYDLGGNLLSADSESAVYISVLVNPSSATLRPTDRVFEVRITTSLRLGLTLAETLLRVAPTRSSAKE